MSHFDDPWLVSSPEAEASLAEWRATRTAEAAPAPKACKSCAAEAATGCRVCHADLCVDCRIDHYHEGYP